MAILACGLAIGLRAQTRFSTRSDLVVLHVAVTDHDGRYVANLPRDAFSLSENGVPQPIALFSGDDTPATIGLLIDDSASMQGLQDLVTAAVTTFVTTSHTADEIFALTFNERVQPVLPASHPFTNEAAALRYYLQDAIDARGRTALYDAVGDGLGYLEGGTHPRKALVLLSDGGDNASMSSLTELEDAIAGANTVIYAVALRDPANGDANPGLLKRLAQRSGGLCFTPRDARGIAAALAGIAQDIRSSYTIAYAVPPGPAGVRHVRVTVHTSDGSLHARTRTEYLAR
jgi:Ca-activated chloride channel family protein